MWKREQPCRSRSSGPGSALELRPRIALPSATGEKSLADLDAAKQHRTIHLLFKPDILTCYQHREKRTGQIATIPCRLLGGAGALKNTYNLVAAECKSLTPSFPRQRSLGRLTPLARSQVWTYVPWLAIYISFPPMTIPDRAP